MRVTEAMHAVRKAEDNNHDNNKAHMCYSQGASPKNKQEWSFHTSHNSDIMTGIHYGNRLLHVHL